MNPEIEFREKYKPDYSGMTLIERPFCEMENLLGVCQTYSLDVITPPDPSAGPRPVVFFVHGGGFRQPCDKRQAYISAFARILTKAGYAVVSPDYPIFDNDEQFNLPGNELLACTKAGEAVHRAYQYITEHAVELGLDAQRISIMGGSAGGMAAFYSIANYNDPYRAFINLWGAPNQVPDLAKFPPTLSIHGNADAMVPFAQELPVQKELEAHGIEHQLITLDGSGHTPLHRMEDFLPQIMTMLRVHFN